MSNDKNSEKNSDDFELDEDSFDFVAKSDESKSKRKKQKFIKF